MAHSNVKSHAFSGTKASRITARLLIDMDIHSVSCLIILNTSNCRIGHKGKLGEIGEEAYIQPTTVNNNNQRTVESYNDLRWKGPQGS